MSASPIFSKTIRHDLFWLAIEAKPNKAVSIVFALFIGLFSWVVSAFLAGFL
jgi:capsular polysaccharide biosynthesis protein